MDLLLHRQLEEVINMTWAKCLNSSSTKEYPISSSPILFFLPSRLLKTLWLLLKVNSSDQPIDHDFQSQRYLACWLLAAAHILDFAFGILCCLLLLKCYFSPFIILWSIFISSWWGKVFLGKTLSSPWLFTWLFMIVITLELPPQIIHNERILDIGYFSRLGAWNRTHLSFLYPHVGVFKGPVWARVWQNQEEPALHNSRRILEKDHIPRP